MIEQPPIEHRLNHDPLKALEPAYPPRKLVRSRDNWELCNKIGIRFNGLPRRDVNAYDCDEGWIVTTSGRLLYGPVEPYWRQFERTEVVVPAEVQDQRKAAAEAKRARKNAARLAARSGA